MMSSFSDILALLPEGATWVIPVTIILLLLGWISSIVVAAKQKGLVLLAFIPLTNPLAVVAMLFKQTSSGLIPFTAYALALGIWLFGSNHAHKVEFERLHRYENMLKEQGEPLGASAYLESASNPDKNVWEHPYLKPIGLAGQKSEAGEQARKNINELYDIWSFPNQSVIIRYEDSNKNRLPFVTPVRTMHQVSLQFLKTSNPANINRPESPEESAEVLKPYFDIRAADLAKLQEAVNRPEDVYPHAWNEGFDMMLPQLVKLKKFSQVLSLWSVYHSTLHHQEDSFQTAQLAFRLAETGDSDLLISRLVQFAQYHIALETIMAAQQAHLWSDEQWVQIRSILDSFNATQLMPASLRSERAMGYSHIQPLFTQSWSDAMKSMAQIGGGGHSDQEKTILMKLLDSMASKFSQAFLAKQWRLCLEAYSMMIEDLEQSVKASTTSPWKDIESNWVEENVHHYGIFAKMLLPALSKAEEKAFLIQVKIELAKTAIDLERYYIKFGSYPDTLEDLSPSIQVTPPIDPMTRQPLAYQKIGQKEFEIYSVGLNGIDDGGQHLKSKKRNQPDPPDDVLWGMRETDIILPAFHIEE
jgi:hypothetical protein